MLVFLHIPKTAGSTFQFILENSFGPSACHTNHSKRARFDAGDLAFAGKLFPWMRSIAGHNLLDPESLPINNPFYITFLREPIARVISHYQDSVQNGDNRRSFEESLRHFDYLSNCQVRFLGDGSLDKAKRFLERCHFVGLTERFELSLDVLQRMNPCRLNLRYKRRRTAASNELKDSVLRDPRLLEMARDRNQLDLELYSFAVNDIFPRQCERVGVGLEAHTHCRDFYRSELRWKFLLCQLYNMLVYRQACKFLRPSIPGQLKPEPIAVTVAEGSVR